MTFPSPNPLWIVEIVKFIVIAAAGGVLFFRWHRSERHFLTDTPFLFALGFFCIASGEAVDAVFDSGFATYNLTFYQFRAGLLGIGMLFVLYATVLIWFVERQKIGHLLIVLYAIMFLLALVIAQTPDQVRSYTIPFLLIVYIGFLATFMLAWYMKRLPDVHGLIMCLGGAIALVGQILKNPLEAIGYIWISELIDLLGLSILFLGLLIKPGYAKSPS